MNFDKVKHMITMIDEIIESRYDLMIAYDTERKFYLLKDHTSMSYLSNGNLKLEIDVINYLTQKEKLNVSARLVNVQKSIDKYNALNTQFYEDMQSLTLEERLQVMEHTSKKQEALYKNFSGALFRQLINNGMLPQDFKQNCMITANLLREKKVLYDATAECLDHFNQKYLDEFQVLNAQALNLC